MKKEQWILKNNNSGVSALRSLALLLNAFLPFLMSLKDYINGRIFRGAVLYLRDYILYVREERKMQSGFSVKWRNNYPILTERYDAAGSIPRHYFWQDLWAARKVYESKVPRHQ